MRNSAQTCLAAAVMAALAGCATPRVSETAYATPNVPRPAEILVDVSAADFTDASQARVAQTIRANLETDLIKDLTAAKVFAEPLSAGTQRAGTAVLHVTITDAASGNAVERIFVGFGAGSAKLQVAADLRTAGAAGDSPLVAFTTSSDSGRKPGLILPIAGVLDLTRNARGIDGPMQTTARTLVDQLEKYYASVGWYWPTADHDHHS